MRMWDSVGFPILTIVLLLCTTVYAIAYLKDHVQESPSDATGGFVFSLALILFLNFVGCIN